MLMEMKMDREIIEADKGREGWWKMGGVLFVANVVDSI